MLCGSTHFYQLLFKLHLAILVVLHEQMALGRALITFDFLYLCPFLLSVVLLALAIGGTTTDLILYLAAVDFVHGGILRQR